MQLAESFRSSFYIRVPTFAVLVRQMGKAIKSQLVELQKWYS
jgi:hypothetical protein